ncbi:MAG: formylglycine-generating enzyme family protein [Longimicrobiales bacterium]
MILRLRRVGRVLVTALLASSGSALEGQAPVRPAAEAVVVPAGRYVPLFAQPGAPREVAVDAFRMDVHPVSVASFLAFVQATPGWRRDRAPAALAGADYLGDWASADDPGGLDPDRRRPVTRVSWFAARAYCAWNGGRLPTTDEWEYAAAFDESGAVAAGDPDFNRRLLGIYQSRPSSDALPPVGRGVPNGLGLHDLHDLVWEWTEDVNNQMLTGAGRDDRGIDRQLFCAAGSTDATDLTNYAGFLRYGVRATLGGGGGEPGVGFRCVY